MIARAAAVAFGLRMVRYSSKPDPCSLGEVPGRLAPAIGGVAADEAHIQVEDRRRDDHDLGLDEGGAGVGRGSGLLARTL